MIRNPVYWVALKCITGAKGFQHSFNVHQPQDSAMIMILELKALFHHKNMVNRLRPQRQVTVFRRTRDWRSSVVFNFFRRVPRGVEALNLHIRKALVL